MTSELKACEHCRGVAKYETDLRNARVMFYVRCDSCGVGTMGFKTGPEAAAAWNRRAPARSDAVARLVEACRSLQARVASVRGMGGGETNAGAAALRTLAEVEAALAAVEKEIGNG